MNSALVLFLCIVSVLPLTSCAIQRYRAAPIVPAETASRFEARNLSDPGLQPFVEKSLGQPISPWPPKLWDLPTLSLMALYFSPEMQAARARLAEAEAAIVTAGARPNPVFDAVNVKHDHEPPERQQQAAEAGRKCECERGDSDCHRRSDKQDQRSDELMAFVDVTKTGDDA